MKNPNPSIPINLWDDYYEDGHVPEGEIQQTYMYVESDDYDLEFKRKCLERVKQLIEEKFKPGFEMEMEYFDTRQKYPTLKDRTDVPHWSRYNLLFKHLSHETRYELVEKLKEMKLEYENTPIVFYSES